jgi:hypothetical protein
MTASLSGLLGRCRCVRSNAQPLSIRPVANLLSAVTNLAGLGLDPVCSQRREIGCHRRSAHSIDPPHSILRWAGARRRVPRSRAGLCIAGPPIRSGGWNAKLSSGFAQGRLRRGPAKFAHSTRRLVSSAKPEETWLSRLIVSFSAAGKIASVSPVHHGSDCDPPVN